MRVIGGSSRGRRLVGRLPEGTRPTSDRVREAVFDILGSLGGVEGLDVVDLYCGSGAMGLEALSRGAASATFVDSSPAALEAVAANREAVGLGGAAVRLVAATLPAWLVGAGPFDLAFCDPPYDTADWEALLGVLDARRCVLEWPAPPGSRHHQGRRHEAPAGLPGGGGVTAAARWSVARSRRYGGTLVTVADQIRVP